MATQEIEQLRDKIERDLASVAQQIEEAKGIAMSQGIYSDPVWYSKIIGAKKFMGADHQACLRELGKRSKAERQAYSEASDQRFMTVLKLFVQLCRDEMGDGFVDELMNSATDLANSTRAV
jgi:hypothetical protein